jgi:hypothetical protein
MRRVHVRLALALLLSSAALAYDETITPDATGGAGESSYDDSSLTACTTGDCPGDVDEGTGSPDGNVVTTTDTGDPTITWSFPTTGGSLDTSTDAQRIIVVMSRCNSSQAEATGGTDPTVDIQIVCGVTTVDACATGTAITSLDQSFTCDFTATGGTCNSDGSNVAILAITYDAGGGPNKRYGCFEAIDWQVAWAAAGRRLLIVD